MEVKLPTRDELIEYLEEFALGPGDVVYDAALSYYDQAAPETSFRELVDYLDERLGGDDADDDWDDEDEHD